MKRGLAAKIWVHATNWDCVILDEYHYGAWRKSAKELFENEDDREKKFAEGSGSDARFNYAEHVQKWLNLIRGTFAETTVDNLKLGVKKPPLPFFENRPAW